MNLITRLIKRAERSYLSYRIGVIHPDIANPSFDYRLGYYIREAIADYVQAERNNAEATSIETPPRLPSLLLRALAYQATKSKTYYQAQYLLYKERCERLEEDNLEEVNKQIDLLIENRETRKVARTAIDMLGDIRNPAGKYN